MPEQNQRRIVVTGGNKGIGLATVERILAEHSDTFVYLGSRNEERGATAVRQLMTSHPEWAGRVALLGLDVSRDESVLSASSTVEAPLYGIVNNAGIGGRRASLEDVLQVNAYGPWRVCEAFAPLLRQRGRVVIVTSAAGPNFVQRCSDEMQQFFLSDSLTWKALDELMRECVALRAPEDFEARGLGDGDSYGLSKACANAAMKILARKHPELVVNACTPGFVATDMTQSYVSERGKTAAELGLKTPFEGATATLHLLFGEFETSGWYFGSDAQRSPLNRYRSPGDPPYAGD